MNKLIKELILTALIFTPLCIIIVELIGRAL